MASLIHLDTHVLVWLASGDHGRLSPTARRLIDAAELAASPMAILELEFLHEIGRLTLPAAEVVGHLQRYFGVLLADQRFAAVATQAARQPWTRDPFDRLIVGHALASAAPLLTADRVIRRHVPEAVW